MTKDKYVEREVPIDIMYNGGACSFDMNGTKIHTAYIETGFEVTEDEVLRTNANLYNQVE